MERSTALMRWTGHPTATSESTASSCCCSSFTPLASLIAYSSRSPLYSRQRSLDPRQVLVGARVHPHPIARVDKERYLYDDPCLQGCRFGPPCRRVAFEARIRLRNPEVDVRRRLYADDLAVGRSYGEGAALDDVP